jgi:hypothetical protein
MGMVGLAVEPQQIGPSETSPLAGVWVEWFGEWANASP